MNVRLETINKLDLIRQLDTRMIHQKILSKINRFIASSADIRSIKITESDELAIRSAELTEKLNLVMSAFGDFTKSLKVCDFDKSVSSSDFQMLIISLYALQVLQLGEFLMQADILRLKFDCHHLNVDDFVKDLVRLSCVDRCPEFLKNIKKRIDFVKYHVSPCSGSVDGADNGHPTTAS